MVTVQKDNRLYIRQACPTLPMSLQGLQQCNVLTVDLLIGLPILGAGERLRERNEVSS